MESSVIVRPSLVWIAKGPEGPAVFHPSWCVTRFAAPIGPRVLVHRLGWSVAFHHLVRVVSAGMHRTPEFAAQTRSIKVASGAVAAAHTGSPCRSKILL